VIYFVKSNKISGVSPLASWLNLITLKMRFDTMGECHQVGGKERVV
jgi:hypothetical protein